LPENTTALTAASPVPGRAARRGRGPWWRHAVVYQLYVRSFADANGDGIGDLDGIAARLDHIAELGVDGLWLNPCYPSPNRDGGYDVADYTVVDERYGGMRAFEALRDAAHARGLKLLMDLVPNHCSSQHPWFRAAVAAGPGSRERARFIFRDGRGPDGSQPPNNWRSTFGGPAWTRLTGPGGEPEQWYLHSFDSAQPDFDWSNPEVAAMFDDVLRTWFDRGVDGFRIDVAYAMVKHPDLPDLADPAGENPYTWNQPGVHEIFRRWRALADGYRGADGAQGRELTLVGEVWLPPAEAADYIRPGELNQVFNFDLLQQPFEARAFRTSITDCLDALKHAEGVPAWTLNSHDVHRAVTRYGLTDPESPTTADINALRTRARGAVDVALGVARAKAALLLLLALPGSVYLYQGEELGLPEVQDLPDDARQDPIWERSGHTEHGRDGSRVPLPWQADAPAFGFTFGAAHGAPEPWLPQPAWFADYSVDRQNADPGSILAFYRGALRERRNLDPDAELSWLQIDRDDAFAFRRGQYVCAMVFDGPPLDAPPEWGQPVLSSGTMGAPGTATWYYSSAGSV
jgi:alpha-glucosidase